MVEQCCQTVFVPCDVALQFVVLPAEHTKAAQHIGRDLEPAKNIHAIQQSKSVGIYLVRLDFADADVFERIALQY